MIKIKQNSGCFLWEWGQGLIRNGHERTFWDDGNIPYLKKNPDTQV